MQIFHYYKIYYHNYNIVFLIFSFLLYYIFSYHLIIFKMHYSIIILILLSFFFIAINKFILWSPFFLLYINLYPNQFIIIITNMLSKKIIIITLFFLFFPITAPITLILMYCPKFFMLFCCCISSNTKENLVDLFTYLRYYLTKTFACCTKINSLSTNQLEFELPKYWSNYDLQTQNFDQFLVQAAGNARNLSAQVLQKIYKSKDQSLSMIQASNLLKRMDDEERNNIDIITKFYNQQQYSFIQEGLFGEAIFNSQTPYITRKLKYDPGNQFQAQIFKIFNKSNFENIITQNIKFPFNIADLQQAAKNSLLYLLDFPNLRNQYKEQPIQNPQPNQGRVYLHIPYALFVKASLNGVQRLICVCSAFNFTKQNKIKVYSPYLKNQSYKLWNVVRMHIGGTVMNQYTISHHLGILHFKSSRYNVPFYNFINNSSNPQIKKAFYHVYERFNIGLQGINTNAAATLVNKLFPLAPYSFFFTRSQSLKLIQQTSENFKLQQFDPFTLQKELDLTELTTDQSQIYYDKKLYKIIGNFIDNVSKHFNLGQYQQQILSQVNKIIPQNKIRSLNQLMKRLANLWVINHSHTFANLSVSLYYKLNATLIPKPLPFDQLEQKQQQDDSTLLNQNILQRKYMPNNPITLEYFSKIVNSTTLSNTQHIILTTFKKSKSQIIDDNILLQIYQNTISEFQNLTEELNAANARRVKKNQFAMTWLSPKRMQGSLNI